LIQIVLVPVLGGREFDLAPLFRVDSLGLLFGTAWTLALAAIAVPAARQSKSQRVNLLLVLMGVDLLVCAYAHNMVVLAAGWALVGVGTWVSHNLSGTPGLTNLSLSTALSPAIVIAVLALLTGFPAFVPPVGGVAEAWRATAAIGAALAVAFTTGTGLLDRKEPPRNGVEPAAVMPLKMLYGMATPYVLAKMLVPAPWEPVGAWLLVLVGMLTVLIGLYEGFVSQGRQVEKAFCYVLVGIILAGFGIAANSPLAAAGATWVMLLGLPCIVVRGRRWAEVAAMLAVVPGLWMVSQAALDTGYGVVAALLLPAYLLLAGGIFSGTSEAARGWRWLGAVVIVVSAIAAALPQIVVEFMLRPAVRTMAGGVGALTTVGIDWGVGMLVRTPQGTVPAALPATGLALAIFLAAVALYWLKQLAGSVTHSTEGETHTE
jgi:hypothetical protein